MYRGINGTPPSRALSCSTTPTPRNYHRPPSTTSFSSFSFCAFSLSRPCRFSPSVPSFSSSSSPFPYRDSLESLAIFPTPSLSVSLLYVRAHVYLHVFLSRAPRPSPPALEPAVLRLSPRYDHLRIRLPSTRPRSAPEQPSIRYRCVQPRGEGLSAIARIEGCSGLRMRAYTPKSVPTSSPCIATHS